MFQMHDRALGVIGLEEQLGQPASQSGAYMK